MRTTIIAALLSASWVGALYIPATAFAQQDATRGAAGINEVAIEYAAAIIGGDYARMTILSMPNAMLDKLLPASSAGKPAARAKLEQQLTTRSAETMGKANVVEFTVDVENANIQTTASGYQYAVVSSTMTLDASGKTVRAKGPLLAIEQDGRWFLLSPTTADSIKAIKAAFPDLADISLTSPGTGAVKQ